VINNNENSNPILYIHIVVVHKIHL